jgi:YHS domain-containing protein
MALSVEAWRIKVLNTVIEMRQTHSGINISEYGTKGDSYSSNEITLGYIPIGFKLEKRDVTSGMVSLVFKGGKDYFIFFMNKINNSMIIDTEDASVKRIQINGKDAFFSSNKNANILVWNDEEYTYSLSGSIEENKMIKIAESIKK